MSPESSKLVVHIVYRFAVGGLENGVVNLINRLPSDAWRHAVVSLTRIDEAFAKRITRSHVEYVELRKRPGHAIALYPRLLALFRSLRPAIVHTRNLAAMEASLPALVAGVPVRIHGEHGRDVGDLDGSSVTKQWVRRAFRPCVTQYVALSPELKEYLIAQIGVPPTRVEQIFNGVDVDLFKAEPAGRMPIEGCPFQSADLWLVGTVGRLESVKNQTSLAQAFVRILRRRPDARRRMRLLLIGEGTLRPQIETILAEGEASELVWFAGERADVPALLRGLDCFVLPSLAEGVSNTILEAMACGLPVVATRVGANNELVKHGVSGCLVPARDCDALEHALTTYFDTPAVAHQHGRAGRQIVEREFSLERMVAHYDRLYSNLVRTAASNIG